jgi:hypothetical protein
MLLELVSKQESKTLERLIYYIKINVSFDALFGLEARDLCNKIKEIRQYFVSHIKSSFKRRETRTIFLHVYTNHESYSQTASKLLSESKMQCFVELFTVSRPNLLKDDAFDSLLLQNCESVKSEINS